MTNFEALKQMRVSVFANMVFSCVKNQYKSLSEFEEMLQREFPEDMEGALQKLQHPSK